MAAKWEAVPWLHFVSPGNGTTSGVRVPNGDWIVAYLRDLTICDPTSAAFAQKLCWPNLDVVTFSWQKGLGGEAGHGIASCAARRGETRKLYAALAIAKNLPFDERRQAARRYFRGRDHQYALDALNWAKSLGGLDALIARADANTKALANWVAKTPWVDFLAKDATIRSNTSVCLEVVDPAITELAPDAQASFAKSLASLLEKEKVAYDVGAYRDARPRLRIWCGATVETKD